MTAPAPARLPRIVAETLDAFVAEVRRMLAPAVLDIRLFGSYARGEAREDSDVDVLVLLGQAAREDELAISNVAADLVWQLHGVVISPLVLSTEEFERWRARERRVALEINREGVPL